MYLATLAVTAVAHAQRRCNGIAVGGWKGIAVVGLGVKELYISMSSAGPSMSWLQYPCATFAAVTCITCHMSRVTCHVSRVTTPVACVTRTEK